MKTLASRCPVGRRQRIVAVARPIFLGQGYAATSMSQISAELGGSKTTLWSYFGSKEALFVAVADDVIDEFFRPAETVLNDSAPLATVLENIARTVLHASLSPDVLALMRIIIAEAERFPELCNFFDDRGLGHGWRMVGAYFARAIAAGQLSAKADPLMAAQQFLALCQANSYQKVLLCGSSSADAGEIRGDIDAAVSTFLRAYAA